MPNNLSTLLLIGVLLFLIYCLMNKPTQLSNKIDVNNESFDSVEDSEYSNEDSADENTENFEDVSNNNSDQEPQVDNSNEVVGADNMVQLASNDNVLAAPEISREMINQLVSETERKSVPLSSPLLNQQQADTINQFEPSDTQAYSGASLDNAFERPVADTTNTDVVDLNKNNIKNYNAKDYLPKEVNDDWFNTDFSQAKYKMNDDKLINTDKYIIGINTVGQSLKNASYDIRGAVNVPKYTVSPWNNSTVEPDYNIKPLC